MESATPTATVTPTATPTPSATATPTVTPIDSATPTPGVPTCDAAPVAGCRTPAAGRKALLLLKDKTPDVGDRLVWKWSRGSVTTLADYDDPTRTGSYELCLYEGTGLLTGMTVPPAGSCAGRPCWQAKRTSFKYKDRDLIPDGIRKVTLKAGLSAGLASITVDGRGANLRMPVLGNALTSPLTVQLKSTSGICWEAVYSAPFLKNDGVTLRDKAD